MNGLVRDVVHGMHGLEQREVLARGCELPGRVVTDIQGVAAAGLYCSQQRTRKLQIPVDLVADLRAVRHYLRGLGSGDSRGLRQSRWRFGLAVRCTRGLAGLRQALVRHDGASRHEKDHERRYRYLPARRSPARTAVRPGLVTGTGWLVMEIRRLVTRIRYLVMEIRRLVRDIRPPVMGIRCVVMGIGYLVMGIGYLVSRNRRLVIMQPVSRIRRLVIMQPVSRIRRLVIMQPVSRIRRLVIMQPVSRIRRLLIMQLVSRNRWGRVIGAPFPVGLGAAAGHDGARVLMAGGIPGRAVVPRGGSHVWQAPKVRAICRVTHIGVTPPASVIAERAPGPWWLPGQSYFAPVSSAGQCITTAGRGCYEGLAL